MTRGSCLNERPERKKQYVSGSGNGVRFVSCAMQAYRKTMEDTSTTLTSLAAPFESWSFFGVFDGHGGDRVSQHCANHLHRFVLDELKPVEEGSLSAEEKADVVKRGMVQGFLKLDAELKGQWYDMSDRSGSTAVCALVAPDAIYLANCGDSRGLIVSGDDVTVVTRDHKPYDPDEQQRIEAAGGCVRKGRVGRLAMSRSVGDFHYKFAHGRSPVEQMITPEPDVFHWERQSQDQFILLASDGVWDRLEHDTVGEIVRLWLTVTEDLERICGELVDLCFDMGSPDNSTVVLVVLPGAPKPSVEALQLEMEFCRAVRLAVKEVCAEAGDTQLDLMTLNYRVGHVLRKNKVRDLMDPAQCDTLARRIFTHRAWKEMHPGEELRLEPENGFAERYMRREAINRESDARKSLVKDGSENNEETQSQAEHVETVEDHVEEARRAAEDRPESCSQRAIDPV